MRFIRLTDWTNGSYLLVNVESIGYMRQDPNWVTIQVNDKHISVKETIMDVISLIDEAGKR